jgi:hypothetical protein
MTHITAPNLHTAALAAPLIGSCTRSGVIYGRGCKNTAPIAAIWSRICPPDTFSSVDSFFSKLVSGFPQIASWRNFATRKKLPHYDQSFSFNGRIGRSKHVDVGCAALFNQVIGAHRKADYTARRRIARWRVRWSVGRVRC